MQCGNNFKQLGLALLNYESANKRFPPANGGSGCRNSSVCPTNTTGRGRVSGRCFLLPYMEQAGLYEQYSAANSAAWSGAAYWTNQIPGFVCPSDIQFRPVANISISTTTFVAVMLRR